MLKRGCCLLLALALLFSLSGCAEILGGSFLALLTVIGDDRAPKKDIFKFVRENEEELLKAIESGDFSAFEQQGFIQKIEVRNGTVEFYCGGAGFGPETSYVGFYYSPHDYMTAVWCAPISEDSLVPSGHGYEWQEKDGDNWYYTENISGKFYYYEASF